MRHENIRQWVESLLRTFGEPRKKIDAAPLRMLYERKDYPGMVSEVKALMKLDMLRVRFRIIGRTTEEAPLWLNLPPRMPAYGTREFGLTSVILNAQRTFLEKAPFEVIIAGLAHEMSHVITRAVGQEYALVEEAIDLTAILLGFGNFYVNGARQLEAKAKDAHATVAQLAELLLSQDLGVSRYDAPAQCKVGIGYLSQDEVLYAIRLMRT